MFCGLYKIYSQTVIQRKKHAPSALWKNQKLNTKSLRSHEPSVRGTEILTSIQAFVWLPLLALLTLVFQTQQELYHRNMIISTPK